MLNLNRIFLNFLFLCIAIVFFGCGSSSRVLVSEPRSPISPEQVKLYIHPPAKYEEIAIIEASSKDSWAVTDQGKMNKALERLKEEAAKS